MSKMYEKQQAESEKQEKQKEELNPRKILDTCFGFFPSRILVTAVNLEIFTHIHDGYNTSREIAKAANADNRAMEILLNSLVALNFLKKSRSRYGLTPISEKFLVKGIPEYFGDFVPHVDMLWEPWRNLTNVVKTGKPYKSIERQEGEEFFEKLVPQLFPLSYPVAKDAANLLDVGNKLKNLNILDIAAGSGAWSIAFAQRDLSAKVTAQDWPGVLNVTKKFVNKFDLDNRYKYLPGDLREVKFGNNLYDLVILGHICHSEGAENSIRLISKCYDSLKDGGRLLIADFIPDNERCSALFPLLFAVNMLVSTTDGDTFTMSEYKEWLQTIGFNDVSILDVKAPSPLILAIK